MTLAGSRESSRVDANLFRGKRVLICGINYWPEETGIAPYTTGLAEHLVKIGAEVSMITAMPYYPQWSVPAGYNRRLSRTDVINGVKVYRFRQYVPKGQSAARRAMTEASFMANLGRLVQVPKPDLILGVMPSVCGGALAYAASKRYRVPYGVLVQDLSGQGASQSGISGGARVAALTSEIEARILRGASAVAIIAEGFKPHIRTMGVPEERIHRVRNWTHIDEPQGDRARTRRRLGLREDAWIALHAGNMGFKQGLENVVYAAKLAKEQGNSTEFVFVGDGNQRAFLEAEARELDNVRFLPPQPEQEFADVLASADVLLVNQKPTVVDMCLPGKLTSYLAVERPVVAAVAPESDTAIELTRADAGVVIDAGDPVALLSAISDLEQDHGRAESIAYRGKKFAIENLTAETALRGLEHFLEAIEANANEQAFVSGQATKS